MDHNEMMDVAEWVKHSEDVIVEAGRTPRTGLQEKLERVIMLISTNPEPLKLQIFEYTQVGDTPTLLLVKHTHDEWTNAVGQGLVRLMMARAGLL